MTYTSHLPWTGSAACDLTNCISGLFETTDAGIEGPASFIKNHPVILTKGSQLKLHGPLVLCKDSAVCAD
jgi:hypothetical protein